MNIADKTVIITGGASGMGAITARRLEGQGAKVAILDMNEEAMKDMAEKYKGVTSFRCDVSNHEEVEKVVAEVREQLGPIHRLVHAAAIMPTEALATMPVEDIVRITNINYLGTVYMVKAVLAEMLERHSGEIILYGSIAGFVLCPDMGAYSATKAAVNIFGEQLIRECEGSGVHVLLVKPPATNTPLIKQALDTSAPAPLRLGVANNSFADPEDIVRAIDEALEKGRNVLYPNFMAKLLTWLQFYAPRRMWNLTVNTGKKFEQQEKNKAGS